MAKAATVESPNFGSILDRQSSSIERPKPVPVGSYVCVVKGLPRFDKSTKKGTDYVEFTLQPQQAQDDVDEEELAEMGGLAKRTFRATYYITEDAVYRLKEFLDHCGIDEDGTLSERIAQTPGCQVIAFIKHTSSDDGETIYANVSKTAAVG